MQRNATNSKAKQYRPNQQPLGLDDGPTIEHIDYGGRVVEFVGTRSTPPSISAPSSAEPPATEAPTLTAAHVAGHASATPAPAIEQPPQIIAGEPDPQSPGRWHLYTAGGDTERVTLRIAKLGAAVRRVLDVLNDGCEHHAAELYKAVGGLDPSRALRAARELVGRTPSGTVVYAHVILRRIDPTTGAGVYILEWRDAPQPKGDNGVGVGQ